MDLDAIRNEIIVAAKERLGCYKQLISLAEEQREILVGCKHSELPENLSRHEPPLAELARLDQREEALLSRLREAEEAGGDKSPGFERKYKDITAQVSEAASSLRSLVQVNSELLGNAMDYVSFSISILSMLTTGQQSYDPNGESVAGSAVVLDQKV